MPQIVAATAGEALLAETFAAAAPTMFTEFVAAPTVAGVFEGLAADAALTGGLGLAGLEGLGAAGLEGISAAAPSLGQQITQGITSGGLGAGEAGINAAQVAAEQAKAVDIANSGINQAQAAQQIPLDRFPQAAQQTVPSVNPNVNPGGPSDYMSKGIENLRESTTVPWHPNAVGSPNAVQPSALESGFNKAMDWVKNNKMQAASMALTASQLLNKKNQEGNEPKAYDGILTKYKMSPDFKGRFANPSDYQYTPKVYNMASGGIAQIAGGGPVEAMSNANAVGANTGYPMADINKGAYATPYQTPISRNVISDVSDTGVNPMTGEMQFASGGIASYSAGGESALDYYERMTKQKERLPSGRSDPGAHYAGDVGIIFDTDPDTRSLDPVTAAQVRMAKVNKRANMQTPGMKRPTPMGQINMVPVTMKAERNSPDTTEAAQGGIMSLGGYAAGGNPRLLKGPGDGMSDNIPATIAGKQPARLADGEFVVPADVVSHLGNGSTEAGAKKLHQMMTNVRKARTGNPKQGKQINPNKYMPK